jgi:hypothetical protein
MSPRFSFLLALAVACSTTGAGASFSPASEPSFWSMVDQPQSSESTSVATTDEARAAKAEKARRLACESSSSATNDPVYVAEAGKPDCKALESAEPETH